MSTHNIYFYGEIRNIETLQSSIMYAKSFLLYNMVNMRKNLSIMHTEKYLCSRKGC